MSEPLVSAIVLSFNRKEETLECLQSLREQLYPKLQIVVVDNGSKDESTIAISKDFPEVRLIRLPHNFGAWGARDIAIWNSEGELIFMIDSDAVCLPDAISGLVSRIEAEPECGIVQPMIMDLATNTVYNMGFGLENSNREFYRWQFHGCAALIRRSAYMEAGVFRINIL